MSMTETLKRLIKKQLSTSPKIYETYEDALASSGQGYEDNELIEVIALKTKLNRKSLDDNLSFGNSTLSSLAGLLYLCQRFQTINVIDLGGSTGLLYHIIRPLINDNTNINWWVVENRAMTNRYKELFSTSELRFSDNLERTIKTSGDLHLIICSGVIQYLPKPYETLETIAKSNSHYLLFSRMCFSKQNKDVVILQKSLLSENGFGPMPPGVRDREFFYPQTSIQKQKFIQILAASYKNLFIFSDNSGVHYPEWQEGIGVLMERKTD